jgi:imidazolonepropionase
VAVGDYWCERAWLDTGPVPSVRLSVVDGRFAAVAPGPPDGAVRLGGLVLPGFANAHSHAFHRALRGRTHLGGGSFWTWREAMYGVAATLDPDSYRALATRVYTEMARAGITCVGEFHYLHHAPGGARYADPNAMGHALIGAAREAGIRLTLLDTCYLTSTVDGDALEGAQRRFGDGDASAWAARVSSLATAPHAMIGAAVHSVRSVPADQLAVVADWARGRPLHVHLSEQPAENEACLATHGMTPTALLAAHGVLGAHTTAVHATHLTEADIALLGDTRTGTCLCPTTERDLADGLGPAGPLASAGSPLCTGSDSHAVIDPFEEARGVELHERLRTGRRGTFSPTALMDAATVGGHTALGWSDAGRIARHRPHRRCGPGAGRVRGDGRRRPRRDGRRSVDPPMSPHRSPEVGRAAMSLVLHGIGELLTNDPDLGTLTDAAIVLDGGTVAWVGPTHDAPAADEAVDVEGAAVLPGFVDSHAHLVFAGDRSAEFAARMAGAPYTGGGIRTTVAATRAAPDAVLRARTAELVREALSQGTTTIEIKSGYGLTVSDEVRSLRIAGEFTAETTFLGAHVVPSDVDGDAYTALVCGEMMAAAAPHARWVDVFCEAGAFDGAQAEAILRAGLAHGLGLRVHANQLGPGPGVRLAVALGAASADHCTHLSDTDVDALSTSDTVATLLPGAEFSTRSAYPDGRRLLDAGVSVALATDCNPGSSFTTSMPLCVALAVRECGLTPTEAVVAATLGGADALRRTDLGRLGVGARADLVVLDAPSHLYLAYRPGVPLVGTVVRNGEIVWKK